MPARYEAIRDSIDRRLVAKGVKAASALKRAKTSAARIFNSTRAAGEAPVTGKPKGE